MITSIMLLLLMVSVILLTVVLFRAGRKNRGQDSRSISSPMLKDSTPYRVAELSRSYNDSEQQAAIIEAYPGVKEIDYRPVPEGVFPSVLKDMELEVRKSIEAKVSLIKIIPASSFKLLSLLRNPLSRPNEISAIVQTNPVFSAKILQAVNSAYFSFPEKVTSVGRAITLLGYNNVSSLVCHDALSEAIPRTLIAPEVYIQNWVHSAVVSVCAGYFGKEVFHLPPNDLATIGLLHDIGKYFVQVLEERPLAPADLPIVLREEQQYGLNHPVLGALIAFKWQLSGSIAEGIEYHHHPSFLPPEALPESCLKQSFIICLSDLISKVLGHSGKECELLPIRDEYYDMFHLNRDLSTIITPSLLREIAKARATIESYLSLTEESTLR
jgi:HD-like signal output (HDOD) protein